MPLSYTQIRIKLYNNKFDILANCQAQADNSFARKTHTCNQQTNKI